jgi:hypothetical protein
VSRSLLDQLTQIRASGLFDDGVAGVYTSAVAEPVTMSGSLQEDLNGVRTLVKNLKGSTDWFSDLGSYFDPTTTDSGSIATKALNIANIGGNTVDSKTVIIAVSNDNLGSNYTVSGTSTGVLLSVSTDYSTPVDRRGLPIFASTANVGDYWDEGGSDNVCRIDVLNAANDAEFTDGTYTIYAKFHDGDDFGGTGTGNDAYIRFYKNGSPCDLAGTGVTAVKFVYPQRRVMSAMQEYEWMRTDFVSSWEGDVELIDDISNLWGFTGASDDDDDASGWTKTTAYYVLQSDPTDLWAAIDLLNREIGDRDYLEGNYISSGEDIADSLDKLDQGLQDVADSIIATAQKYIEETVAGITKNTVHSLPYSITYTPSITAGQEGKNMDVYVEGQLLAADTGALGANADRDYGETTTSGITFRFNVKPNSNITYIVRA